MHLRLPLRVGSSSSLPSNAAVGRSTLRADGCHLLGDWRTSSFRVDRPDVPETLTGRFRQPPSFGRSNSDVGSQSQAVAQAAPAEVSSWPGTAYQPPHSLVRCTDHSRHTSPSLLHAADRPASGVRWAAVVDPLPSLDAARGRQVCSGSGPSRPTPELTVSAPFRSSRGPDNRGTSDRSQGTADIACRPRAGR